MQFFNNCQTIEQVKATYKILAKQYHPDMGGNTETMQAINAEYTKACNTVLTGGDLTSEQIEAEILNAEAYKNALTAIMNLAGLNIELCGGWLWVSGNTYPHKETLKANGFYFASAKKMWYFRAPEYATSNRKKHTMDEIRVKYGSQLVAGYSPNYRKFLAC